MDLIAMLIMIAGLALIAGAHDVSERMLRAAFGVAVALAVAVWLVRCFACAVQQIFRPGYALFAALSALLAATGYVAWRTRSSRALRSEARRRHDAAPRERELPAAPSAHVSEEP